MFECVTFVFFLFKCVTSSKSGMKELETVEDKVHHQRRHNSIGLPVVTL